MHTAAAMLSRHAPAPCAEDFGFPVALAETLGGVRMIPGAAKAHAVPR